MHLCVLSNYDNKYCSINGLVFVVLTDCVFCAIGTKVVYNLDKSQFLEQWNNPPISLVFQWSTNQNFIAYPPNIVELTTLIIVTPSEWEFSTEQIYNTMHGFWICSPVTEWSCRISDLSLLTFILFAINNSNISNPANLS